MMCLIYFPYLLIYMYIYTFSISVSVSSVLSLPVSLCVCVCLSLSLSVSLSRAGCPLNEQNNVYEAVRALQGSFLPSYADVVALTAISKKSRRTDARSPHPWRCFGVGPRLFQGRLKVILKLA